ncbi:MAG: UDP-N-acetylmuramoyl-L-alanyl-D-glutamate--2,6-diaminopimelate ligase [bacterium]|nr:UDP-N-acetylmuramoyl-L-alanyl-D-glutamate--2,6-diaminopimelate ligase [bacterium]
MAEPVQKIINSEILKDLFKDSQWKGTIPLAFNGIADDSRNVVKGWIFIAINGFRTDGHKFLESAAKAGAALLVVEKSTIEADPEILKPVENIPLLIVENTRLAASILADLFYGHPSRELKIHGVTGTKGKTTTVHLLKDILVSDGRKPAVIGTLGIEFGDEIWKSDLTTPGPIELHKWLRFLADKGATDVCIEVSAHAGALMRTASVIFTSVTYMNLSRDHGDHFSETEYLDAKLQIARDAVKVNPLAIGIGNALDPHTDKFLSPFAPDRQFLFASFENPNDAKKTGADLKAVIFERSPQGFRLVIRTSDWEREIYLPLVGRFNAQNAAAAATIASTIGVLPDVIGDGLNHAHSIPGRLERIDMGQEFLVVVDYAHAPQPASEALACLRDFTSGRLICVMGAGGSRDRGKRPLIGQVLSKGCDIAIITSDNPRNEDPLGIINDILVGITRESSKAEIITEVDRKKAIEIALTNALTGDTVAILGKGHETYQIFKDTTIDFDDREVAREWLEEHMKLDMKE